jgi:hypothetical protein
MTFVANTTTTSGIGVASNNSNNGLIQSYALDGNTDLYIWNAQIEYGPAATAYEAKTTDGSTSEVFRGNKRKFPKLAGIVAEAASVNIYDLTEPSRPMWMRFAAVAGGVLPSPAGSVGMLGAELVVGSNTTFGSLRRINFAKDSALSHRAVGSANGSEGIYLGGIAQRQAAQGYSNKTGGFQLPALVNENVNAVAMTVLPDAPVDPVTGLKVPTIAVATQGGVSVIKQNGTVVNSGETAPFQSIILTEKLLSVGSTASSLFRYALSPGLLGASFAMVQQASPPAFGTGTTTGLISSTRSELLRRSAIAATVQKLKNFESNPAKGVAVTVANTFNTGHLVGDIRRTYLADTDVGSVSGPELVTNGDFSNGTTGWDGFGSASGWSVVDEKAVHTSGTYGTIRKTYEQLPLVVGRRYELTFTISDRVNSSVFVYAGGNLLTPAPISSNQTHR